jgi:hypothetical protein
MDAHLAAAVIDNARWCHLVCATNGIAGRFDEDAWVSSRRTPEMYPDAVTLVADASGAAVLARVDASAGCSIKDSFATLDLAAAGFEVLFDAEWIASDGTRLRGRGPLRWERVARPADLRSWALDHGAGSTFTSALLDEPSVTILSGHDRGGRRRAGAIATEGDTVVGISNVFVTGAREDGDAAAFGSAFAGAAAAIGARYPGRPIVGYLAGPRLEAAQAAGFEAIGPLRVWLRGSG